MSQSHQPTACHPARIGAGVGAFVMRGAGCTMNDMWDRGYDGRVARTAQRPLAAKRLSMLQAWTFLGAQLTVGLGILLQLNWPTIELGVASVALVAAYPLMKRFTHFPQVSESCARGSAYYYQGSDAFEGCHSFARVPGRAHRRRRCRSCWGWP
jgi:4-hydroxybenzoate polyprenyltransferase